MKTPKSFKWNYGQITFLRNTQYSIPEYEKSDVRTCVYMPVRWTLDKVEIWIGLFSCSNFARKLFLLFFRLSMVINSLDSWQDSQDVDAMSILTLTISFFQIFFLLFLRKISSINQPIEHCNKSTLFPFLNCSILHFCPTQKKRPEKDKNAKNNQKSNWKWNAKNSETDFQKKKKKRR